MLTKGTDAKDFKFPSFLFVCHLEELGGGAEEQRGKGVRRESDRTGGLEKVRLSVVAGLCVKGKVKSLGD